MYKLPRKGGMIGTVYLNIPSFSNNYISATLPPKGQYDPCHRHMHVCPTPMRTNGPCSLSGQ